MNFETTVGFLISGLPWLTTFRQLDHHFKLVEAIPGQGLRDTKHVFNAFATMFSAVVFSAYVFLPPSELKLFLNWKVPGTLALVSAVVHVFLVFRYSASVAQTTRIFPVLAGFLAWITLFVSISCCFGYFRIAQSYHIISGAVHNSVGTPIGAAVVTVSSESGGGPYTRTNGSGRFTLAVEKAIKVTEIEVLAPNYQSVSEPIAHQIRDYYDFSLAEVKGTK